VQLFQKTTLAGTLVVVYVRPHLSRNRRVVVSVRRWFDGKKSVAFVALSWALIAAGCGGGQGDEGDPTTTEGQTSSSVASERGTAADVFDRFNAMSGDERHEALVEAAQEEGEVSFYTTSAGMEPVISAFEDEYGIDVNLFLGQSETVVQRIVQEHEAGFYGVDVHDDHEAFNIAYQGYTYEYINSELTDRIPGYDPKSHVAATRMNVYTQGWNTDLMSDEDIPDTVDGFTDPRFEGQLSIDPRDWRWYIGLSDYYTQVEGWTQEEVDEMIRTLASYSALHEGHVVQGELLLAGEFPVSMTIYTQNIDRSLEADPEAPVTWKKSDGSWIEPLVFAPAGSALMKNAPHPAAAMLLIDFLLTEGQVILAETDRTPTSITQPGGPLEAIPNEALHQVDPVKALTEREEWTDRFDELLRGS
jgi:iron(III) transport system substrate-binding protein